MSERLPGIAEVRRIVQAGNVAWGQARVRYDRAAFDAVLDSSFFVRLPDRTLTRQQFIELVSSRSSGARLTRFDPTVLTIQRVENLWVAIILERIERVAERGDDAPARESILAVTRDGWKETDGRWTICFSELLGEERWSDGQRPPVLGW